MVRPSCSSTEKNPGNATDAGCCGKAAFERMGSNRVARRRRPHNVDDHEQRHNQLFRVVRECHDARRSLRYDRSECERLRPDLRQVLHGGQYGATERNQIRVPFSNGHHRFRPGTPANHACYVRFCLSRCNILKLIFV